MLEKLSPQLRAPILMNISLLNKPSIGKEAIIELVVTSLIDTQWIKIELILPEGLFLTEGERIWTGPLSQYQKKSFIFKIPIPDGGLYKIVASAEIRLSDGSQLGRTLMLEIDAKEGGYKVL